MAGNSGLAVVGIVILLLVGVAAIDQAAFSVGDPDAINETFTPSAGSVTQLDQSERDGVDYGESVVVKDENRTLASDGTDYTWNATNGTVRTLSGGILDGDANATVEYEYRVLSEPEQNARGVVAALLDASVPLVFVGALVVVVVVLRGLVG